MSDKSQFHVWFNVFVLQDRTEDVIKVHILQLT